MKKQMVRLLGLILCLSLLVTMAVGCGGEKNPPEGTTASQGDATETTGGEVSASKPLPDVDLGGMTLILGDWWSPATYEEDDPMTAWDQMVLDYHHEVESELNFTFNQIGLQNQGEYNSVLINSFINNDPACHLFWGKAENIVSMASQGLLYDLSTLDAFDLTEEKWPDVITDYFTVNGKVYAARADVDEPRTGVFFNKRLLEDAGIDPDLPYDLQESGEWTWEAFESLCAQLTQDYNSDGVTDIYGLADNPSSNLKAGVYSNGAMFVTKDESGKFVDGTTDPKFLEGMEWAVGLYESGYVKMKASGDNWDHYYYDFIEGRAAMLMAEYWITNSYLKQMGDDYGYVMMPAGPNGTMGTPMYPTPICIPACLDKETANKVAAAYDAWTDTYVNIEGAEMLNASFRDIYYGNFRDSRAVNETVTSMVTDPECQFYDSYYLIPNYNVGDYFWEVSRLEVTPAEKIEELRPINQAAIDAANVLFGN